jgi:hypothetical protein
VTQGTEPDEERTDRLLAGVQDEFGNLPVNVEPPVLLASATSGRC